MTPEFKAANSELLKAIKMNDKTDAVLYTDLEAINKAMKANDGEKVGAGLKKVQLKFKDAEKKLNEDLKDVTQRFSEAQKEVNSVKEKSNQIKSVQQLFDKAKSLVDSLKTSPKNASKLTIVTDKLKQYGDLSGKAQKVIQLISAGKDASKQIDVLAKAVLSAEKKFKKESSAFAKEFNKSRDAYIVLKERLKICKDKLAAFQKERLYIANVVKQIPSGDLRQKREQKEEQKKELPPREITAALSKKIIKAKNAYKQAVEEMNKAVTEYESTDASKFVNEKKHAEKLNSLFSAAENMLSNSKDPKTKLIYNWLKKISESFKSKGDIEKGSTDALYDMSKLSNEARKAVKPIIDYYNKYKGMKSHLQKSEFNGISSRTISVIRDLLKNGKIQEAATVMSKWMYDPKTGKTAVQALSDAMVAVNKFRKKLKVHELSWDEFRKAISSKDYIEKLLY